MDLIIRKGSMNKAPISRTTASSVKPMMRKGNNKSHSTGNKKRKIRASGQQMAKSKNQSKIAINVLIKQMGAKMLPLENLHLAVKKGHYLYACVQLPVRSRTIPFRVLVNTELIANLPFLLSGWYGRNYSKLRRV
jgi:hypothetical protein